MTAGGKWAKGAAFITGDYCPIAEAKISILDWGLLRSDATYDVVHVWKGRFFRLDDHIARFQRSLEKLHLKLPCDEPEMRRVLHRCVALTGLQDAYVEMAATRGEPSEGSRDPRLARNTFFAFAIPFVWIMKPERFEQGLKAIVAARPRIPSASVDARVKNYHWQDLTAGLFEAYERGAETPILLDIEGNVAEGPGFNVFVVRGGRISTPASNVLEGITRQTVLDLAAEIQSPVHVGKVARTELASADEIFLSSTAGGIMPVTALDGRPLGTGTPGPVTRRLHTLYWQKKEAGWHGTPVEYETARVVESV